SPAMTEALDHLEQAGNHVNALRVRSFPFSTAVEDFVHEHDRVFIVEQNRDAQLKTMLMADFTLDARKLISVLHYDGTPITARLTSPEDPKKPPPPQGPPVRKSRSIPNTPNPSPPPPPREKKRPASPRRDYEGAVSTLCAGCGHDSISAAIIQACYELDILPH